MSIKEIIEMSKRNSFLGINESMATSIAKMHQDILAPLRTASFGMNSTIFETMKQFNKPILEATRHSDTLASLVQFGMKNFLVQNQSSIADAIKSLSIASSFAENSAFSILNSMKSSGTLASIASIYSESTKFAEVASIGALSALKVFESNKTILGDITKIAREFESNRSLLAEALLQLQSTPHVEEYQNSDFFRGLEDWIKTNFKEIKDGLTVKALATVFFFILTFKMGQYWSENALEYEQCLTKTRSNCNMRDQGATTSRIVTKVPRGSEVVLLSDEGRWKKVRWINDSGDVFEGWIYCSLLQKVNFLREMEINLESFYSDHVN